MDKTLQLTIHLTHFRQYRDDFWNAGVLIKAIGSNLQTKPMACLVKQHIFSTLSWNFLCVVVIILYLENIPFPPFMVRPPVVVCWMKTPLGPGTWIEWKERTERRRQGVRRQRERQSRGGSRASLTREERASSPAQKNPAACFQVRTRPSSALHTFDVYDPCFPYDDDDGYCNSNDVVVSGICCQDAEA